MTRLLFPTALTLLTLTLACDDRGDTDGAGGRTTDVTTTHTVTSAATTSTTTTATSSSSSAVGDLTLDVNDVSFLWPATDVDAMPRLSDHFTAEQLEASGLLFGLSVGPAPLDAMRIVAVRVDPCFVVERGCEIQVRLVAQPLQGSGFADNAIHLFFVQPPGSRPALRAHLARLRALAAGATDGVALGPHPVLSAEGPGGPYATALRAMLTETTAPSRLREVAVMNGAEATWAFFRFAVDGGVLTPMPTTGGAPHSEAPTDRIVLLRQGLLAADRLFDAEAPLDPEAPGIARRIENPVLSPTSTVDCGTCHAVSQARVEAEAIHQVVSEGHPDAFVAPPGFSSAIAFRPEASASFRAFGYTESATPSVLDRVVFESILSAADLAHP